MYMHVPVHVCLVSCVHVRGYARYYLNVHTSIIHTSMSLNAVTCVHVRGVCTLLSECTHVRTCIMHTSMCFNKSLMSFERLAHASIHTYIHVFYMPSICLYVLCAYVHVYYYASTCFGMLCLC